jgi:predicted acylesterase/phospholipase RssA
MNTTEPIGQPASASATSSAAFPDECDLVMKGGITSGIVYPLAVVEIAKAFRLRSIGGTSAGAIAAAAAAAAEAGRQRRERNLLGGNSQCRDFDQLAQLPFYLSQIHDKTGKSGLLGMFRAEPRIAELFDGLAVASSATSRLAKGWQTARCLVIALKLPLVIGFIFGVLPLAFMSGPEFQPLTVLWLLLGGLVCAVVAAGAVLVRRVMVVLKDNRFGLCSGMPAPGDSPEVAGQCLTVWLHAYLDELSGQRDYQTAKGDVANSKPLTFGDLRKLGIDLQMMTTCLSQGRPYRLPFRDDVLVRDNTQFYYREAEFRELFPAAVVDWMVANQRPARGGSHSKASRVGYCRLTQPDDLPVVVAVRMSLSFPMLLSAIEMHATDYEKKDKALESCWFSDGGISSNFPIHFFDSPLPQRPTFGLDLGLMQSHHTERVYFTKDNNQLRLPSWRRFSERGALGALSGFFVAVFNTASDWSQESLSGLPGFRDRIGLIRLKAEEGGLNLAMPAQRITDLSGLGREAGKEFVRRFGDCSKVPGVVANPEMNWTNHQLIRLRLLIASVTEMLESLNSSNTALSAKPLQSYQRFFGNAALGPVTYRFQQRNCSQIGQAPFRSQAGLAQHLLDTLLTLAAQIEVAKAQPGGQTVDPVNKAPKPTPELKLKPRI